MIIPKDATPTRVEQDDLLWTPEAGKDSPARPGSAFRRVPPSPVPATPLTQIRGRPPRPFYSARPRMPSPPRRSPDIIDIEGSDAELERTMCTPVQRHAPARDAPWSAPGAVFRPICASPLTPPNATSEINRHAARHAVECYVVYGAKLAARRGGKDPRSPGAARLRAEIEISGAFHAIDATPDSGRCERRRPSRQPERSAACSAARPGRAARYGASSSRPSTRGAARSRARTVC